MINDGNHVIVIVSGSGTGLGSVNIISDPVVIQEIIEKEQIAVEKRDAALESLKDFEPYKEEKFDMGPKRNKKGKTLKNWQTTTGWK